MEQSEFVHVVVAPLRPGPLLDRLDELLGVTLPRYNAKSMASAYGPDPDDDDAPWLFVKANADWNKGEIGRRESLFPDRAFSVCLIRWPDADALAARIVADPLLQGIVTFRRGYGNDAERWGLTERPAHLPPVPDPFVPWPDRPGEAGPFDDWDPRARFLRIWNVSVYTLALRVRERSDAIVGRVMNDSVGPVSWEDVEIRGEGGYTSVLPQADVFVNPAKGPTGYDNYPMFPESRLMLRVANHPNILRLDARLAEEKNLGARLVDRIFCGRSAIDLVTPPE